MVKTPQIILIDGPAGSGKTTLSLKLQSELNCQVIHLDKVYDGWDNALSDTLTKRLLELIHAFTTGIQYELPIFDWQKDQFDGIQIVQPADILIIEGVGAGQRQIRALAQTLYWVEADQEIGLQRVLDRDGFGIFEQMKLWKVREAEHFAKERTREFADFIITTT